MRCFVISAVCWLVIASFVTPAWAASDLDELYLDELDRCASCEP